MRSHHAAVYSAAYGHYIEVVRLMDVSPLVLENPMRAEAQKFVDSIQEALALLRRYL